MMYIADLYVVVSVDDAGNVVGYPQGGGSSTKSAIRAFESRKSAERSLRGLSARPPENWKIMRVTALEEDE